MAAGMHVGLLVMFFCSLFLRYNGVSGRVSLSEQEDLELEQELKRLNKPAIKTIKTQYGEIYDCVDFYKQPAFDHPLLKNHSYHFEMKPQFPVEKTDEISHNETLHIGLDDGGCPVGTVPIKRITKQDLIRVKLASKAKDFGGTYIAIARANNGRKFTGALGFVTLYNPPVLERQYSAARIQIQNGNDFIQFGWRVDLTLYGDKFTHLFIQTSTSSAKCFDALCGFVLTRRDLSPGFAYPPSSMSTRGGKIFETKLRVQRDRDGNWWLSLGKDNTRVGFWPKALVAGLGDFATYVDWGGDVSSPHLISAPQMGSGIFPSADIKKDAYFRWVTGVDIGGNDVNVETEPYKSNPDEIYAVLDEPSRDPVYGHQVFFGGN